MSKTTSTSRKDGKKSGNSKAGKPARKTADKPREDAVPAAVPALPEGAVCDAADQAVMHAAEQVYTHLIARVKDFQETLPENYELGIQLANFGGEKALHVRGMGYRNPNIIEFYGLLDGQAQVAVVQHVSQLNFLLIAVPPVAEEEPYRIGFGAEI